MERLEYLKEFPEDAYLLTGSRERFMEPRTLDNILKGYLQACNIENMNYHVLRHSHSMHLNRNGMPLPLVAEWLGHARMDTTRKFYANADTAMKKDAIDKATSDINPLSSGEYDIEWEDDEELLKRLYCLK